ncbi:hypothetical protein Tco_1174942 [Tanacetum coccineum]
MTNFKLVRDLHTTKIDQLHAYLGQHEFHANESPQYGSPYQSQQYSTYQSSTPLLITYPSNDDQSSVHHNVYSPSSSIPQLEYAPTVNQQPEFSQPDSDLIVPVFQKGDDPIDAINHMMSFLTVVVTSHYPTTNNQQRNLSNPRQQATINDGRVIVQPIQGRQTSLATGTSRTYTLGTSGSNSGRQRTVICYNYKGEGQGDTVPNRAQANGSNIYIEELAITLADPMNCRRPTKVEVPKELLKVSMVNTSLKKLKHHLAGFDVVVKERTTATAITEGSWGFEHTKACFRDEIIPFVKADKYGYMKNHKKTVKNGQTRTQERKSEQKPEAKARKSQIYSQLQSILVNRSQQDPKCFKIALQVSKVAKIVP